MAEEEEKLPAELRMKLEEAEKFRRYRYPDWKRGFRFGFLGIFSAVFVIPIAYMVTMQSNAKNLLLNSAGIVAAVVVITFVFGAFRPPRGL